MCARFHGWKAHIAAVFQQYEKYITTDPPNCTARPVENSGFVLVPSSFFLPHGFPRPRALSQIRQSASAYLYLKPPNFSRTRATIASMTSESQLNPINSTETGSRLAAQDAGPNHPRPKTVKPVWKIELALKKLDELKRNPDKDDIYNSIVAFNAATVGESQKRNEDKPGEIPIEKLRPYYRSAQYLLQEVENRSLAELNEGLQSAHKSSILECEKAGCPLTLAWPYDEKHSDGIGGNSEMRDGIDLSKCKTVDAREEFRLEETKKEIDRILACPNNDYKGILGIIDEEEYLYNQDDFTELISRIHPDKIIQAKDSGLKEKATQATASKMFPFFINYNN